LSKARPLKNLFSEILGPAGKEIFETLLQEESFKLERIVSSGQATPAGQWYDQETNEWVILLRGSAGLVFDRDPEVVVLHPGDYIHVPAHLRHRVEWTDPEENTIWLALHYR
jgi:cupin 2 domain-containing protein